MLSTVFSTFGVRHHDQHVLRPALGLDALAARRAARVDAPRDRRRADERDAAHERVVEQRLDASRSPWTRLKTPFGRPIWSTISATSAIDIGTCSLGLTM